MTLYVVTGATGFIGRHLIANLVADGIRVKALTRAMPDGRDKSSAVEWVTGDFSDAVIWKQLVQEGCMVINLAFSNVAASTHAIAATERMVEACAAGGATHLIHCSTVSVYGRSPQTVLTEESPCHPADDYGKVKLQLEEVLKDKVQGRFALTIVRPSTVFGEGGDALVKLVRGLASRNCLSNYLQSSLFGRRKTHLVPVETVVAAIRFVASIPKAAITSTFIVSEDEEPLNNFFDVERIIRAELGLPPYCVPLIPMPRGMLEALLWLLGRANTNTQTVYRSEKLAALGFNRSMSLETAVRQFVSIHKNLEPEIR